MSLKSLHNGIMSKKWKKKKKKSMFAKPRTRGRNCYRDQSYFFGLEGTFPPWHRWVFVLVSTKCVIKPKLCLSFEMRTPFITEESSCAQPCPVPLPECRHQLHGGLHANLWLEPSHHWCYLEKQIQAPMYATTPFSHSCFLLAIHPVRFN